MCFLSEKDEAKLVIFALEKDLESFAEYTDRWDDEVAGAGKARVARCLTRLSCKGPCFVTSMHAGRGCIALYHI